MRWMNSFVGLSLVFAACGGEPVVPREPTWADVQPIIVGQCGHCHGAYYQEADNSYRFDIFATGSNADIQANCGEAAEADLGAGLVGAKLVSVGLYDIAVPMNGNVRMPPPPAEALSDWELTTIKRWADNDEPLGDAPAGNRRPNVRLADDLPDEVEGTFSFDLIAEDPNHEPVFGIVKAGDARATIPGPGRQTIEIDASMLTSGSDVTIEAVVCDGWVNRTVELGTVRVQ